MMNRNWNGWSCLRNILLHSGLLLSAVLFGPVAFSAEPLNGWRGNQTGLWPDAQVPLSWSRIPHGALEGMRGTATPPAGDAAGEAPIVVKGLLRDWLIIGPFDVGDSTKDFGKDALGGEDKIQPKAGDQVADKSWKGINVPPDDPMVFGTAVPPVLDFVPSLGFKINQLAYAHTWFHSPRGGKARIIVDHTFGFKMWLNGKEIYSNADRQVSLGTYPRVSRFELDNEDQPSPTVAVELKAGWNRLLVKISTPRVEGHNAMNFTLRVMDPPDVETESKNIHWMTPLPARSTSTPILAGSRIFVIAEPDELVCIDKDSGKIMWSVFVNPYQSLTDEEHKAKPAFATRVDPLIAELRKATDRTTRLRLRKQIQMAEFEIDPDNLKPKLNDHFEAHFGIVGYTMPTPVSDGQHVWVWNGMGVAACFDMEGHRQWITRINPDHLAYGSSPAIADGVFVTFMNKLYGFDAATGKKLWEQSRISSNSAGVLAATFGGQQVIVTQRGEVIRPRDGKILFRPPQASLNEGGWCPPVIVGNTLYLPKYGVTTMTIWDFAGVNGEKWEPQQIGNWTLPDEVNRLPGGAWIDRSTAGSPLIWEGMAYETDIWQSIYAVELKTGKMIYRKEMELEGFMHYNAVPVAASPTLIGKHIFVCDNQGTTLILEPGPTYKVVARNTIHTVVDRVNPLPSQETLQYAPPITDGKNLYLRGEAYLYCVGTGS